MKAETIREMRKHIEKIYNLESREIQKYGDDVSGGFDEILCFELHTQPVNPRMRCLTYSGGFHTGLTFKELAQKWGITLEELGELIADHCRKLDSNYLP